MKPHFFKATLLHNQTVYFNADCVTSFTEYRDDRLGKVTSIFVIGEQDGTPVKETIQEITRRIANAYAEVEQDGSYY
ncbi:hypothetical protein FHQ25_05470 [Testudinibacter sp. TR-2022]|uniref:hypothetical protein n=1 Tax=Testudinibacter sp. TR-2022 TaxID=2585029 RepID=UPI00111A4F63|nr:hypothetical protein [Testudinibacter sp. TR-2022]TNH03484.1 hypothetical protein FHQ22_07950 [Pasteurellaceae bacterium Phil31]TNH10320.1 hypothetical protein FHQ25_05470 [Testudinibacter sp. TR-2022]